MPVNSMDELDHRTDDPVVQKEFHIQPDSVSTCTEVQSFDHAENQEARERYSAPAARDKRDEVRRKKGRHATYERKKHKKSHTKDDIKKSLRWGDSVKKKRGRPEQTSSFAAIPLALFAGVAGMMTWVYLKKT